MGYRKFRAAHLFTGKELLENNHVLITEEDGTVKEIVETAAAGDDIAFYDGIITPGFVNTHCHLELSHMKGVIPKGSGLIKFLTAVIKERFVGGEEIQEAMKSAYEEMYRSGTQAVADICNSTDSLQLKSAGNICWRNFIEVIGFTDKPEDRFNYARKILNEFESANYQCVTSSSLVPHAPYSVSHQLFSLLDKVADTVTTIHNQESSAENDLYREATGEMFTLYRNLNLDPSFFRASGTTSIQTCLPWMRNSKRVILVHNTYISREDLSFIQQQEQTTAQLFYFAVCLRANQYIESVNPPLELLINNNCRLTLGTDSYASNDTLNLFDEMKSISFSFPDIDIVEILKWGTLHGAECLEMDDKIGSFDKGRRPGVVYISNVSGKKFSHESISRRLL
jgi:aminodeoxyfutalosine deaminase